MARRHRRHLGSYAVAGRRSPVQFPGFKTKTQACAFAKAMRLHQVWRVTKAGKRTEVYCTRRRRPSR